MLHAAAPVLRFKLVWQAPDARFRFLRWSQARWRRHSDRSPVDSCRGHASEPAISILDHRPEALGHIDIEGLRSVGFDDL